MYIFIHKLWYVIEQWHILGLELERKGPPTPAATPRGKNAKSARERRRDSLSSQKTARPATPSLSPPAHEDPSEIDEKIIGAIQSHIERIDLLSDWTWHTSSLIIFIFEIHFIFLYLPWHLYTVGAFFASKASKILQKRAPAKNRSLVQKNGSLTDFSYNL